jgi:hypothetical protein
MAKNVILERRCDNHLRLDQRETTEILFNHNVQLDGGKVRHLDLCSECAGELTLAQLTGLLRDIGGPAEELARAVRRKPAEGKPELEPAATIPGRRRRAPLAVAV